ncbi:Rad52/Rad22 family DNA repair protein [Pelagibacterium sp. 26DY04]|uniref:Rad52/Rad22 family DNA repair protein n=1 Tax=Pelagibacterium sp. 26DY04 TaxID=2967130 RepID=UPI002815F535|nr:Rad52/Rad22 family DNA repair protein [Pelagibacterium sp. 26DY04]WMT88238.1 Rad52/Rad22 family DNA repair protein [Pelagibacterium sp. 26DY04]
MSGVTIEQLRDLHRPFPAEAIHWRAQMVTKARQSDGYAALALAYLDARDVMDRLDQVCTPANWQSEHFDAGNGRMGCRIGILINDAWVWKSDGAGDTDIEAEKGAFSGALKRAAVSWGIGRYLYDLGNVWVPCDAYEQGGKPKFKKFVADPWAHVKNAAAFLPKPKAADAKSHLDALPQSNAA